MKADKTKKKGTQHNLENVVNKEETPVEGCLQNAKPRFVTMVDVAALLENEKAKLPKERLFLRRPLYPVKLLNKPYPKRYEPPTFSQYDIRKGSTVEHVSNFLNTMGPYARDEDPCLRKFSKSLSNRAYT